MREKKRRVEEERFGDAKGVDGGGERMAALGPRSEFRRFKAASHSVHGWVCDSPM